MIKTIQLCMKIMSMQSGQFLKSLPGFGVIEQWPYELSFGKSVTVCQNEKNEDNCEPYHGNQTLTFNRSCVHYFIVY